MAGFGDTLRHARANKGVTLTEAERALRIPRKYLRALEDEDFEQLPEGVYSRGIVRNYAQYLFLDPDDAIAYFEDLRGGATREFKVVPAVKPMEVPSHFAPNFALIAFMVVISAVLFAWLYSAFFADTRTLPATTTAGVATATMIDTTAAIIALTPTPTAQPTPTPEPSPTPEPTVPPTRARAGAPVANQAVATPTPAAQPARGQLHVVEIKALDRAWVQVTVDGVIEYAETMPAGRTRRFEGRSIAVSSGNAEKVYLWIDGKDYGVLSTTNYIATVTVP